MEKPYIFTFIIAYKHQIDRLSNLKKVIEWVLGFNGVELIIVEQDRSPKLPNYSLRGFKYIFTQSYLPFNKAWSFNVALKSATTNVIIFGDSDIIMDPNEFISSVKLLETYESVSPYNRVIDLEANEGNLQLNQLPLINRHGRGEAQGDIQKICLAGGIIMYRKDSLMRIGGFSSEDFCGWGGEDDYASIKIKHFLKYIECPNRCYHLHHAKVKPDMVHYQRNLQLLNKLASLSKEDIMKYTNNTSTRNGMKNKCYDK